MQTSEGRAQSYVSPIEHTGASDRALNDAMENMTKFDLTSLSAMMNAMCAIPVTKSDSIQEFVEATMHTMVSVGLRDMPGQTEALLALSRVKSTFRLHVATSWFTDTIFFIMSDLSKLMNHINGANADAVVDVLWGLAKLWWWCTIDTDETPIITHRTCIGLRNEVDTMISTIHTMVPDLQPVRLVRCAWALATFGCTMDNPKMQPCIEAIIDSLHNHVLYLHIPVKPETPSGFTQDDCVDLIKALAGWKCSIKNPSVKYLVARFTNGLISNTNLMMKLDPMQIAIVISSLSDLQCSLKHETIDQVISALNEKVKSSDPDPSALVVMLNMMITMRMTASSLIHAILDVANAAFDQFTEPMLMTFLHLLTELKCSCSETPGVAEFVIRAAAHMRSQEAMHPCAWHVRLSIQRMMDGCDPPLEVKEFYAYVTRWTETMKLQDPFFNLM